MACRQPLSSLSSSLANTIRPDPLSPRNKKPSRIIPPSMASLPGKRPKISPQITFTPISTGPSNTLLPATTSQSSTTNTSSASSASTTRSTSTSTSTNTNTNTNKPAPRNFTTPQAPPSSQTSRSPVPPSGIHIIIVGSGFAGLSCAISSRLKGHRVTLLERSATPQSQGDVISFGANGGRILQRWSGVEAALDEICHKSPGITFYDYKGNHIVSQIWDHERQWGKMFNGHRGEMHRVVWDVAMREGVEFQFGCRVVDYFEDGDGAGVVVKHDGQGEGEERLRADVVVAADGVKSLARRKVLGIQDSPRSSGYAIYRAWYDADELMRNPETRWLCENGDNHAGWLGPDVHFLVATMKGGKEVSWVMTHKDNGEVPGDDSVALPGKVEDALKVVQGWHPIVHAIIKTTPPDRLIDWKLMYRDPLPTWISPKARIALIGDAAHPFLPTSIQGASQSMEDGVTIAACLDIAGKGSIPEALRAYEKIRYDRVRKAQETGVTLRDRWHRADYSKVHERPDAVKLPREQWLLGFDAEAHAYNTYADAVEQQWERVSVSWFARPASASAWESS